MLISTATIQIHLPWVQSLKEKRMVVKSLCSKISNKFNVSIIEADMHDMHKTLVIAYAAVTIDRAQADSIHEHVIQFIDSNTEGEIVKIVHELL